MLFLSLFRWEKFFFNRNDDWLIENKFEFYHVNAKAKNHKNKQINETFGFFYQIHRLFWREILFFHHCRKLINRFVGKCLFLFLSYLYWEEKVCRNKLSNASWINKYMIHMKESYGTDKRIFFQRCCQQSNKRKKLKIKSFSSCDVVSYRELLICKIDR